MDPPEAGGAAGRRDLERLENVVSLLDDRFRIPGTPFRFGLDPVLGLIPGVGDLVSVGAAVYTIRIAADLGVPLRMRTRMALNVAVDFIIGAVPLVGDVFDFAFKANRRNIDMIRRHVSRGSP